MATVKLDPAKGIQIPNLTTTERNAISSPETGAIIWNTTTSEINQYNGSAWEITYTPVAGITSSADATAITIDSSENVGIGVTPAMSSASYNGLHIGATYPTMKLSSTSSGHAATDGFHLRIDSTPRVEYWNYENTDQVFANNNGEKLRIQSGGGISFNGDTAAANALDDYEEGTCSIQWSDGTNVTGNANNAFYTKVGRMVTVSGDIMSSGVSSLSQSLGLRLVGFPFNFAKNGAAPILTRNLDVPSGTVNVVIYHASSGSHAEIYSFTDHGAYSNVKVGDLHGSTNDMYFTVTYQAS